MEKSKFYVIIKETMRGMSVFSGVESFKVVGIALTIQEAEFVVSGLRSKPDEDSFRTYTIFSFQETTTVNFIDKNSKEYKKFLKDKRDEINAKIEKEKECIESDSASIKELAIELSQYEIR